MESFFQREDETDCVLISRMSIPKLKSEQFNSNLISFLYQLWKRWKTMKTIGNSKSAIIVKEVHWPGMALLAISIEMIIGEERWSP